MELGNRLLEVGSGEVRPAAIGEIELGVSAFPEKKVAQPLFPAGADQEIDIATRAGPVVDFAQRVRELFARKVLDMGETLRRAEHGIACGIVDRDAQIECRAVSRGLFGGDDRAE
jgi:hypothetical protein